MVPGLEAMGIRMLLNECAVIVRGDQQIYVSIPRQSRGL
jgi:hypothetical protein